MEGPAAATTAPPGGDVVIYYNDSIDSDNLTAAMVLSRALRREPNTRIVWIMEPRQAALGRALTSEQHAECRALVEKHFPNFTNSLKVTLGGLLDDGMIDAVPGLTEHERTVLRWATKGTYGPKEDAALHSELTTWDQVSCLAQWTGTPVNALVDLDSLDEIENPVNLNFHHEEQLATRTADEVRAYQAIVADGGGDEQQRRQRLREWYRKCTAQVRDRPANRGSSVRPLDLDALCETVPGADSVRFFGGSSLRLLQRFIERGVADKVQCQLQVGSCDLSVNLFPNQFNIGLNVAAARFVLARFRQFADFKVVPSHSAQNVAYSLAGLTRAGGACLEKRCLGFNCREAPLGIASGATTLAAAHAGKKFAMPDCTTFLCALRPGYMGSTLTHARVEEDEGGALLFRRAEEGIPMYDIAEKVELDAERVVELLESLGR